jgi:enamine deaminase RidA (YjgF/YER057c/UK114 family)
MADLSLEAAMTEGTTSKRAVRRYITREAAQTRAYSQAVMTEGGKIIWLAGQVAAADASGRSLAGDFDGQVREIFSRLGQTIAEAGGTLADMVTMTVFITDARFGTDLPSFARRSLATIFQRARGLPSPVSPAPSCW